MSSPMVDLPEHFPMALNKAGQGPEMNPGEWAGWVCWCADGARCEAFIEYLRRWGGLHE